MKVRYPHSGLRNLQTHRSKITVGEITAKDAILEFAGKGQGKPPLRFDIHQISLRDVGWQNPAKYQLQMHTSEPPADISAAGKFGVWDEKDASQTPMSGDSRWNSSTWSLPGHCRKLSSTGNSTGASGTSTSQVRPIRPDFQVKSSVNRVQLKTVFNAYLDGMNGDVYFNHIDAHYRKTDLVAQGSIAKSPNGKGKTTSLDIRSNKARIDDILLLFTKQKRAPMSGDITLTAKVTIPSGQYSISQESQVGWQIRNRSRGVQQAFDPGEREQAERRLARSERSNRPFYSADRPERAGSARRMESASSAIFLSACPERMLAWTELTT